MRYINTTLCLDDGRNIVYNYDFIADIKNEIESFLESEKYMNTLRFAKKMMMSQEIKSNNSIEGINDDLTIIDEVIKHKKTLSTIEKNRIINLYHGYQYILTHKDINKDSLKELYFLLSYGLLNSYCQDNMGEYYRQKPVYIYEKNRYDAYPVTGINENKIDYYMNCLFDYINTDNVISSNSIEHFIKSQIIHFYFVYIHPYFDINGRSGRSMSMWYLLNKKAYPYIIFNRAIAFNQSKYESKIITTKKTANITLFLEYILSNVRCEFEKEYVIHSIEELSRAKLTKDNLQTLEYILTMSGNITAKDFVSTYNRFNDSRRPDAIISEKLEPLIEKNIIIPTRSTKKYINNDVLNYFFRINDDCIDVDKNKLKMIDISKYTKRT